MPKIKIIDDMKGIFSIMRRRDFSGNTGTAIKNSSYQFTSTTLAKFGSFIFSIILARTLLPEIFGLYVLSISTILFFGTIASIGVEQAIVVFASKNISNDKPKTKSYLSYLVKLKLIITSFSAFILLLLASFISNNYYQKPIFWALIAGVFYILFFQISKFFQAILQSTNSFKETFYKESIFQILRIILIILVLVFISKNQLTTGKSLFLIIFSVAISYLVSAISFNKSSFKKLNLEDSKKILLNTSDKKKINLFLLTMSATTLSGIFLSYVDMIMLGRFVLSEFVGYYGIAMGLIGGFIPLIGFGSVALLPLFSKLKGLSLEEGFRKSLRITLLLSIPLALLILLSAPLIISIIYGEAYLPAVNILRMLSLFLVLISLSSLYQTYFISQAKPEKIVKLLLGITLLNILLNYLLITALLSKGYLFATYGAGIATIISQAVYLVGLSIKKNSN